MGVGWYMIQHDKLFIGGEWCAPASAGIITVFSPSSGECLGFVPEATAADVNAAVMGARAALAGATDASWNGAARGAVLRAIARGIEDQADELARIVSQESGVPWMFSRPGIGACIERCLFYADLAETFAFEEAREGARHRLVIRREPIGVVAAIVPWNAPLNLAVTKLAPAVAAGCGVILKPAQAS
jgi:aldehyde dehydrogenase (NAD+)